MPQKTHRTALVAIPPENLWEPIQAIRRIHDGQVHRWMPHINLLYPFWPAQEFDAALPVLAEGCSNIAPFQVTLRLFRYFSHRAGRTTIWLAPEPEASFVRLQAILQDSFPGCDDVSRFAGGFTPHLSVGQAGSPKSCQQLLQDFQSTWSPIQFELSSVALIRRDPDGPFEVDRQVALRGGTRT